MKVRNFTLEKLEKCFIFMAFWRQFIPLYVYFKLIIIPRSIINKKDNEELKKRINQHNALNN